MYEGPIYLGYVPFHSDGTLLDNCFFISDLVGCMSNLIFQIFKARYKLHWRIRKNPGAELKAGPHQSIKAEFYEPSALPSELASPSLVYIHYWIKYCISNIEFYQYCKSNIVLSMFGSSGIAIWIINECIWEHKMV